MAARRHRNSKPEGNQRQPGSAPGSSPLESGRVSEQVNGQPEAQEAFVQLAAHELRTPLTVLHGMLQLALSKGEMTDARCRPLIESAHNEALRMQAIIDGLTEATRLRNGELALQLQLVDLNDLAATAVQGLPAGLTGQRLQLSPHAAPLAVRADPSRFAQAVRNVVTHVAERAPTEGTVLLGVRPVGGWGCLQVEGRGPTLRQPPTAPMSRERHEPAGSPATPLGLRLYAAEQVLRLHGGRLAVSDEPDVRLIVDLSLPLVDAAER